MFGFSAKDQEKKAQQARLRNAKSRVELTAFLQSVIERTAEESAKEGFRRLKGAVESFPPCADPKAPELDKKIEFVVNRFRTQSFQFNNYFQNADTAASGQYSKANGEIFSLILPVLENQLALRNGLMSDTAKTKRQLRGMPDFQRTVYLNDKKERESLEERWSIDITVLEYTVRYRKLFYEEQILQNAHEALVEKLKTDKVNRDSIIEQLEQLDRDIAKLRQHQSIVAREMADNKDLRGMMSDLDIERFCNDNQYGQENFLKLYGKMADEVKSLAKKRTAKNSTIDDIRKEYASDRKRATPEVSAPAKSKYYTIAEDYDASEKESKLRSPAQPDIKEDAGAEKDTRRATNEKR